MSVFVSPTEGRVTSEWGYRERHPVSGARGFHRGLDIAPPRAGQTGHPVYAAYGGTVRAVRRDSWAGDRRSNPITGTWNTGNFVLIDGAGGGSEWYGHLATVDVRPGQKVKAGDRIGTQGRTGNVTGIHLHFERWAGRNQGGGAAGGNTVNPRVDFNRHGVGVGSKPKVSTTKPTPAPLPKRGQNVVAGATLTKRMDAMGYKREKLLATRIRKWQRAQLYAPGLVADGVWGPASEAHYQWTREFQRALNRWAAVNPKLQIDGDYRANTGRASKQMQDRNPGARLASRPNRRLPNGHQRRLLGVRVHPGVR